MKQGTKKSLGVAALGAAFVAAGAGVASADTQDAIGPVADTASDAVQDAPVEDLAQNLPAGSPELAGEAQDLTAGVTGELPETTEKVLPKEKDSNAASEQLAGQGKQLLGGLPVAGDVAKNLPANELGTVAGSLPGLPVSGA